MKTWKAMCLVAVVAVSSTRCSFACLWDRDTLVDEQRGLPEITATIVGRYERHTPEFYERRIRTASAELPRANAERAKLLLDDIAVAQDRLKRYDQAIATAQQKTARFGVDYRVASNLGTFYLHNKDLPQAETWINRALSINAKAHFGREWVQLQAIRYFQNAGKKPFWSQEIGESNYDPSVDTATVKQKTLRDSALLGIQGLIKIGDRETPEYYAALGELLAMRNDASLATMAMWRALELADPKHPKYADWQGMAYWDFGQIKPPSPPKPFWSRSADWTDVALPFGDKNWFFAHNKGQADLKRAYLAQRAYADEWRAAFQARETALMNSNQNPEDAALFTDFYEKWGKPQEFWKGQEDASSRSFPVLWPIAGAALVSYLVLWRARNRKRRARMA